MLLLQVSIQVFRSVSVAIATRGLCLTLTCDSRGGEEEGLDLSLAPSVSLSDVENPYPSKHWGLFSSKKKNTHTLSSVREKGWRDEEYDLCRVGLLSSSSEKFQECNFKTLEISEEKQERKRESEKGPKEMKRELGRGDRWGEGEGRR